MLKTSHSITKQLSGRYITGLSILAVLAKVSQTLLQNALKKQQKDASLINMSGRQRMLSQKIMKLCALIQKQHYTAGTRSELLKILKEWSLYHEDLKRNKVSQVDSKNSRKITNLFKTIDPYFQGISRLAYKLYDNNEQGVSNRDFERLLFYGQKYLQVMEEIVSQYDHGAVKKVNITRKLDNVLFGTTLMVLVAEAIFIFRPAVKYIRTSISWLEKKNLELESVNKRLSNTKQELLEEKENKHLAEMHNQKIKTTYLITGQERERERISREVHDGLGQMLTASKIKIEKLLKNEHYSQKEKEELRELKQSFSEILDEARLISFNLMPTVLKDFGVVAAITMLVRFSERNENFKIHFYQNIDDQRFNNDIEITIYRIVQECLNNAVKYAQCNNFYIDLFARKNYLNLRIIDDGIGFNYDGFKFKNKSLTFGLNNVVERAHLLNGKCSIDSKPGKGTKIFIKVPEAVEKVNGNF